MEDVFHLPVGKLGDCSREVDITAHLPRFRLAKPGRHRLRFTLREGPDPTLDKVQILHEGEIIPEVECEEMLPAPPIP